MKIYLIIFFLHLLRGLQATEKVKKSITAPSKHMFSTDSIKFDNDPPDPQAKIGNIDETEQRNIRPNNYIKFEDKEETAQIVTDNYQNIDDSNHKNIKNQEGTYKNLYIGEQEMSDKRVVFEDDKNISPQLNTKKNTYRLGIPSISGSYPANLKFQDPNTGFLNNIQPHSGRYNFYPGYPPQYAPRIPEYTPFSTNLVFPEQNHPKYPRQKYPGSIFQKPGLYPEQGGPRPAPYYGSNYAAGYQRPYGQSIQPNLAQRAISAVTEALTSIALYDDKQCVPRLLCEVSTGSSPRSPALLKATAGLGPLLTLLQSYNGLSSSPLFIFGRAAILGATSRGNPTTCRYAYPDCPNDPDKLINYLNNHNGGFFRFFGQPQKQQQNLEQFYNQLSGQYGHLPDQQQINNAGQQYAYQNPFQKSNAKIDNEIAASDVEERIQNKPIISYLDDNVNDDLNKWRFPDELYIQEENKPERKRTAKKIEHTNAGNSNTLKFPDELEPVNDIYSGDEDRDLVRKKKIIFFPKNQFSFQTNYESTTAVNLKEYVFDYKHKFYVKNPKYNENNNEAETLYIVRGNNDPQYPEIVKITPGGKFQNF